MQSLDALTAKYRNHGFNVPPQTIRGGVAVINEAYVDKIVRIVSC